MMNPFLQVPAQKPGKGRKAMNDELAAEQYAQSESNRAPHGNIGLWVGNLLIRMGNKLTQQDIDMKTSKEHA
jgi:hypothetical protein